MKVSVSIPETEVEFLDSYAERHHLSSRSAAVQRALKLLRSDELGEAYEAAWAEWAGSDDEAAWEVTTADGLRG